VESTSRDAGDLNLTRSLDRLSLPYVQHIARVSPSLLGLAVGIGAWELVARVWTIPFLPPFTKTIGAAIRMIAGGEILPYLAASLVALIAGYALAVALGFSLGGLMGRYRPLEYLLDLYVNILLSTPNIVLVPVLYTFFGFSRTVQIAIVFLAAFPIVAVNTMTAIHNVDSNYLVMARSFGAKDRELFWKILIPGGIPLMMAGLRLAMGRAIKGMISGEMFIALFGIGGLLRFYGNRFDAEKVFAILLVVMIVALVLTSAVQVLERRATRWTWLQ
jgi:NitT/TauT family transport system permease protein